MALKFSYSPEISLGTIAEILVVVGAIAGSYNNITNRLTEHDTRLQQHAADIATVKEQASEDRKEVRDSLKDLNDKVTRALVEGAKGRAETRPR